MYIKSIYRISSITVIFVIILTLLFLISNAEANNYQYSDDCLTINLDESQWICVDNNNYNEKIDSVGIYKDEVDYDLKEMDAKFVAVNIQADIMIVFFERGTTTYKNFTIYSDEKLISEFEKVELDDGVTRKSIDAVNYDGFKFIVEVRELSGIYDTRYNTTIDGMYYEISFVTINEPTEQHKSIMDNTIDSIEYKVEPADASEEQLLRTVGTIMNVVFIFLLIIAIVILRKNEIKIRLSKKQSLWFIILLGLEFATEMFTIHNAMQSDIYGVVGSEFIRIIYLIVIDLSVTLFIAAVIRRRHKIRNDIAKVLAFVIATITQLVAVYLSSIDYYLFSLIPYALMIVSYSIMTYSNETTETICTPTIEEQNNEEPEEGIITGHYYNNVNATSNVRPTSYIIPGPLVKPEDADRAQQAINEALVETKTIDESLQKEETTSTTSLSNTENEKDEKQSGIELESHFNKDYDVKAQAKINVAAASSNEENFQLEGVKAKVDNPEVDTLPVNELKILKELYDDGIITEKEFIEKKKQLLGI